MLAMPTQPRHSHAHRTPAQHTHHTHRPCPQPVQETQCPSARATAHSPIGSAVHSGLAHLQTPHTPLTQTYTWSYTQIHSQSHAKPTHYTHIQTLSHTNTLTHMRTLIHSHKYTCSRSFTDSQIPAQSLHMAPSLPFVSRTVVNHSPTQSALPIPGPKTVALVPESLSQPEQE